MFRMNVNGSYLQWLYSRCLLPSWYRQKRFKLWLHLFFMKMKDQELFRNVLNTSHCLLIVFPVLCAWTCANTVLVLKAFREVRLLKHKEDLKKPASETGWWQQRPRSRVGQGADDRSGGDANGPDGVETSGETELAAACSGCFSSSGSDVEFVAGWIRSLELPADAGGWDSSQPPPCYIVNVGLQSAQSEDIFYTSCLDIKLNITLWTMSCFSSVTS